MTELLEQAVAIARELDPHAQDRLARIMLAATEDEQPIYEMTPEEEAAVQEGLDAADRGDFATDEEMAALWTKYEL